MILFLKIIPRIEKFNNFSRRILQQDLINYQYTDIILERDNYFKVTD